MSIWRQFPAVISLWRAGRLARAGHPVETLRVTESAAGLTSDDYLAAERLRSKLQSYLDGMPDPLAAAYASTLAGALGMVRRNLDGL
ncbi:MAG: hypothetical protein ABSF03_05675, partial [Streptosporangiaceae bacterium]